jgi:hypothetical protein
MADKRVNLIISLKDGVSSGMQKMRENTNAVGESFKKLGQIAATYLSFKAVIGSVRAVISAYSESESASRRLANTFTALGEDGNKAAEVWGKYAESIMKVTTLDDEVVLGLVAQAKTMGIANENIKAATEGAIGLSEAMGVDLSSALKMTAMAMNGEYMMLDRQNAAMRAATTDAEKAAVAQKLMAQGLEMAKQKAETIAGAWQRLKTSWSEALEQVGRVLFGDGSLTDGLKKAKEWLDALVGSAGFNEWALNLKANLELAADAMKILVGGTSAQRADVWTAIVGVIKGGLIDAGNGLLSVLAKGLPILGAALGAAVMGVIKGVNKDGMTAEQKDIAQSKSLEGKNGLFAIGDRSVYNEYKTKFKEQNRTARLEKEGLTLSDKFKGGGELAKAQNELQEITDRINEENKASDYANQTKIKTAEDIAAQEKKASEEGIAAMFAAGQAKTQAEKDAAKLIIDSAQKEYDTNTARINSAAKVGGFRSIAEQMLEGGSSVKGAKSKISTAIEFGKKYGLGSVDSDEAAKGQAAQSTALSLLGKGFGKKSIEKRLAQINEVSGFADKAAGAVPAELTNKLLEEQNQILKDRLGGVK